MRGLCRETSQPPEILGSWLSSDAEQLAHILGWNWKGENLLPSTARLPENVLASLFTGETEPALYLITGPSGAGKTVWCQKLAGQASTAGFTVGGILSEPVIISGCKVAIDLIDVAGKERKRLAVLHAWPAAVPIAMTMATQKAPVFPTAGRWRFDPVTLCWGNRVLDRCNEVDMLIIDELGPLEFEQEGGLEAAFTVLARNKFRLACVTVRPLLLSLAHRRWPQSQIITLTPEQSGGPR